MAIPTLPAPKLSLKNRLTPQHHLFRCLVSLGLALAFGLIAMLAFSLFPAHVRYRVQEIYRFDTAGEANVALGVLLPRDHAYQRVRNLNVGWVGSWNREEAPGVQKLMLEGLLPAGESAAVIDYEVTLFQAPIRWQSPIEPSDLQPEPEVESDAALIQTLAEALGPGVDHQAIYRRFAYVATTLDWPEGSRENVEPSALEALKTRVGVCAEFANLTVALNRAAGVPARAISGLAFSPGMPLWITRTETWNHAAQAHAWIEYYTPQGWEMADPSWAGKLFPFLYFGRSDGSHLSYGDKMAEMRAFQSLQEWAGGQNRPVIAAMLAPLKFVVASSSVDTTVTPTTAVQKIWDGRWMNTLLVLAVMLVVLRGTDEALIWLFEQK